MTPVHYNDPVASYVEITIAAAVPILVFAIVSSRTAALRPLRLLGILTVCLWAAPYVATGSTPVALDYLGTEYPHRVLAHPGFLPSNPLINDVPLQFLPWREAARRAVLAGELPVLDRSAGGGTPLLANPQAGIFYPPNLVSLPLTTFSWPLFVSVTKLLVALSGTFLFLRRHGLSTNAARFGSVAYSFSTFTLAFLMFPHTNVTTLFPWLLVGIDSVIDTPHRRAIVTSSLITAVLLTAGHPESAFHCALFAVPYGLFRVIEKRSRAALLRLAVAAAIGGALAAVALFPFVEYVPHTQRIHDIATIPGFLATPELDRATLVTLLVPNYYGNPRVHNYRHDLNYNELATQYAGLVALVLALLGATCRSPQRTFWVVAGMVAFLLSNQLPHVGDVINRFPLFDITAHGRLRFVFTFAIAVLAAFGFDAAAARATSRRLLATVFGIAVVAICTISYPVFAQVGVRRLILFTELGALASLALLLRASFGYGAKRLLVALLFVDLFSVCGYYNPAVGREWFYPQTTMTRALRTGPESRFTGLGRAVMPNSAIFFDAADIRPHDPMSFRPYVAVLDAAGLDRSGYFAKFNTPPPRPLLDFLGVRRIAAPPSALRGQDALTKSAEGDVVDNAAALPRFFGAAKVVQSSDPVRSLVTNADRETVYSATTSMEMATPAVVTLEQLTSSTATLRVESSGTAFIASSESALPGWSVTRGERPVPIETINGAFIGWRVAPGTARYVMKYTPPGLFAGTLLSLLATIILAALWFSERGSLLPR